MKIPKRVINKCKRGATEVNDCDPQHNIDAKIYKRNGRQGCAKYNCKEVLESLEK